MHLMSTKYFQGFQKITKRFNLGLMMDFINEEIFSFQCGRISFMIVKKEKLKNKFSLKIFSVFIDSIFKTIIKKL